MNCVFCQSQIFPKEASHITNPKVIYVLHICTQCSAHFTYSKKTNKIDGYVFHYQDFVAMFWPDGMAQGYFSTKFVFDKIVNNVYIRILTFDFIPNITPQNIEKKLPTLLVFS